MKFFGFGLMMLYCSTGLAQEVINEPKIIGETKRAHFKYTNDSLRNFLNEYIVAQKLEANLQDFDDLTLVLSISDSGLLLSTRCMVSCAGNEQLSETLGAFLKKCEWIPEISNNGHGISHAVSSETLLSLYFDKKRKNYINKLRMSQ